MSNGNPGPGLTIGLPTLGRPVSLDWACAWKSLSPPINYNIVLSVVYGKPVADARNEIAEIALKNGSKYLFFIGDDVVVPFHTLRQLIFRMENMDNLGVVGGVYCSKSEPPAPLVFRGDGRGSYWDWKVGEFFEVTGLGMDCTLIRTDLLNQLKEADKTAPWFKTVVEDDFDEGKNSLTMWTEDLWFLRRVVKETGYKVYCDGSIICDHVDVYNHKTFTLPANSKPVKGISTDNKTPTLVDIGSGGIQPKFDLIDSRLNSVQRITVDIRDETNPDYRCDARKLPMATDSVDFVFSSHCLEHFSRAEYRSLLGEWFRILKPGGEAFIVVPNLEWAFKNYEKHKNDAMNVLYGGQSNQFDFHYNGFTPETLEKLFVDLGMIEVKSKIIGTSYNLLVTGKKHIQESVMTINTLTRVDKSAKTKLKSRGSNIHRRR